LPGDGKYSILETGEFMAETAMKKAFHYYLAFQDEINKGHLGEYAAIANNKVLGYYTDRLEAELGAIKQGYKPGDFNVSLCRPIGQPEVWMGFVPVNGARL
jgi:hypothetical protein